MSLLQLLTTGKSLVGVTDGEGRYRLSNQKLLPHFGPTRNPFSSKTEAEPAQAEARTSEKQSGHGALSVKLSRPDSSGDSTAVLQRGVGQAAVRAKFDVRNLAGGLWLRLVALLAGCQAKVGGLFAHSDRLEAKSAIPRFPKPAVQGELSLDRIKVVRNDLSDADLELVPAKPSAAPVAVAPAAPKLAEAKCAWAPVASHAIGAGKA